MSSTVSVASTSRAPLRTSGGASIWSFGRRLEYSPLASPAASTGSATANPKQTISGFKHFMVASLLNGLVDVWTDQTVLRQ